MRHPGVQFAARAFRMRWFGHGGRKGRPIWGDLMSIETPEDLAELLKLSAELEAATVAAIAGMRENHSASWQDIARASGTTKKAAFKRWSGPVAALLKSRAPQTQPVGLDTVAPDSTPGAASARKVWPDFTEGIEQAAAAVAAAQAAAHAAAAITIVPPPSPGPRCPACVATRWRCGRLHPRDQV